MRQFTEAYGLEKSAVSEHFIEASRSKLQQLLERQLNKLRPCALLIDATPFESQQLVVALAIGQDGRKTILGIRQGATENTTVVGELLGDLAGRGLDFSAAQLYVLDGGKEETLTVHRLYVQYDFRDSQRRWLFSERNYHICCGIEYWLLSDR